MASAGLVHGSGVSAHKRHSVVSKTGCQAEPGAQRMVPSGRWSFSRTLFTYPSITLRPSSVGPNAADSSPASERSARVRGSGPPSPIVRQKGLFRATANGVRRLIPCLRAGCQSVLATRPRSVLDYRLWSRRCDPS